MKIRAKFVLLAEKATKQIETGRVNRVRSNPTPTVLSSLTDFAENIAR